MELEIGLRMSPIMDFWVFPNKQPYQTQLNALEWMEQTIDKKYHILELPVGSGKSAIAMTWAKFLGSTDKHMRQSYIMTPQKILQQQYFDTMPDMGILKGKGNYICTTYPNVSCDIGGILGCNLKDKCTYSAAKQVAFTQTSNVVLNYHNSCMLAKHTDMERRHLLVIDECHNLENFLTEFDAFTITDDMIQEVGCIKYQQTKNPIDVYEWIISTYLPRAVVVCEEMEAEVERMKNDQDTSKSLLNRKIKAFAVLSNHLEDIRDVIEIGIEQFFEDYVMVMDKTSVKFKNMYARNSFSRYLNNLANHVLLMSGTILDKNDFCRNLGIDPNEAAFLSLESEFDIDKRPVFYIPTMKMNKDWNADFNKANRATLLNAVIAILEQNENESGIIHTSNFLLTKWIIEELEKRHISHQIFHHTKTMGMSEAISRDSAINGFIESTNPAVLISPSITEGLDLKDELSRFAIILKVPYPSIGDEWIKRRMSISNTWYQQLTLRSIIQGAGRVVRHSEDYGSVYILDTSWNALYNSTKKFIPKWWSDAYQEITL